MRDIHLSSVAMDSDSSDSEDVLSQRSIGMHACLAHDYIVFDIV